MERSEKQRTLIRAARHLDTLRKEALRIYRPLPDQAPIHTSKAKRIVIRGGNRSGKTLNGAVKVARKVATKPEPGEKGKGLIVSLDNALLAKNCYTKLFEEGAFRVCKTCALTQLDCDCGPTDATSFRIRSKPAPPLIPERLVERFAWLERGRHILDFVVLRTGWTIEFRSVESTRKKAEFLQQAIETLGVRNARAIWTRAEDHLTTERVDVVVVRAVSSVRENIRILRKVRHSLKDMVMLKGTSWSREVRAGEREAERLGFKLDTVWEHELPEEMGGRAILVYRAPGGAGL